MYNSSNESSVFKRRLPLIIFLLLLIVMLANIFIYIYANNIIGSKIKAVTKRNGCDITWENLKYKAFFNKVDISNVQLACKGEQFVIDKITVIKPSNAKKLNEGLGIQLTNMRVLSDGNILERLFPYLSGMELANTNIKGGIFISSVDNNLVVDFEDIEIEGIGAVDGKFCFKYLSDRFADNILEFLLTTPLCGANIVFDDRGFSEKVAELLAKDLNISKESARLRILSGINRNMQTKYEPESLEYNNLVQLYRFFDNPDKIEVEISLYDNKTVQVLLPPSELSGWRRSALWLSEQPYIISTN